MVKTTVYLSDEQKGALTRMSASSGRSEAELIREAIDSLTRTASRPRPRGGLFASGDRTLSERAEAELRGFGDR